MTAPTPERRELWRADADVRTNSASDYDGGWHCAHEWLDRPESDTRECLICGVER